MVNASSWQADCPLSCNAPCPGQVARLAVFRQWLRLPFEEQQRDLARYLAVEPATAHLSKRPCLAHYLFFSPESLNAPWVKGMLCHVQNCVAAMLNGASPLRMWLGQVSWADGGALPPNPSPCEIRMCLLRSVEAFPILVSSATAARFEASLNALQGGKCSRRLCLAHYLSLAPSCAPVPEYRLFLCCVRTIISTIRAESGVAKVRDAARVARESAGNLGVSLKLISSDLLISTGHLATLFRDTAGLGLRAYLRAVRVVRAAELLRDTTIGVSDIGERLGHAEPANFAREFRSQIGVTPAHFRKITKWMTSTAAHP